MILNLPVQLNLQCALQYQLYWLVASLLTKVIIALAIFTTIGIPLPKQPFSTTHLNFQPNFSATMSRPPF